MGIFTKKEEVPHGLIGVDIGAGGIKAAELIVEKGRLRLHSYGYAELTNPEIVSEDLLKDTKRAAALLTRILKDGHIQSKKVHAALPSADVFHAIVTIPAPRTAKEDIKPQIEKQVEKLLPVPLSEMILDSTIIDKHLMPKEESQDQKTASAPAPQKERQYMRVLVSGAPKTLVQTYVDIFKLAKLELVALETEAFALIRSLVGRDKARIMIVDIGHQRTNITLVQDGLPFMHRSIKAGGVNVTQVIADKMGISLKEAEQTKLDLVQSHMEEVPPALKEAMMPILHEIRYSLELYGQQQAAAVEKVDKIIITGGSSTLPQVDTFFTQELDINVYLGDPWARIALPEGLRPVLDEIGPRMSVAVGLAMKEM